LLITGGSNRVALRLCCSFGLVLAMACSANRRTEGRRDGDREALRLEVSIESSEAAGPMATVTFTNEGTRAIAITRTFGLEGMYLILEIERDGVLMPYPAGSQYEMFGDPGYACLQPGRVSTLAVNLDRWYHVIGGQPQPNQRVPAADPPYSFGLSQGRYRVRAVYESDDDYEVRCPIAHGPVRSEWVDFGLP
jgi:hypothetical protein